MNVMIVSMNPVFQILAHAQEEHEASTTGFEHLITTPWVYLAALTLILAIVIYSMSRIYHKNPLQILLACNLICLIAGIFGLGFMPVISSLLITFGAVSTLVIVMLGLRAD